MRRRKFLKSLIPVTLAGCVGAEGDPDGETATEFPESTETAEARATETPDPRPSTAREGPLEVQFLDWTAKSKIRYNDPESDSLKYAVPAENWWLRANLRLSNLGGEAVDRPSIGEFTLYDGGHDIFRSPEDDLGGIPWDRVREEDDNIPSMVPDFPGGYKSRGDLEPGDHVYYTILFDVTGRPLLITMDGWNEDVVLQAKSTYVRE